MDLRRRRLLTGGLATLGAAGLLQLRAPAGLAQNVPLHALAAAKGLVYGTALLASQITDDAAFAALVLQQAGIVTTENDMKWEFMNRGRPDDDDFRPADTVADFATEHGLALRGHNLLWYRRTPAWFLDLGSRAAKESAIVRRIERLAGRYRGRVHSWDVVNEPIEPRDGRSDSLRRAVFLDALGPDYLDLAHRVAHEADPAARLVVNEYDVEFDAPEYEARRAALLKLVEAMQQRGTPLHAVGIQAHLSATGGPPFSAARLRRFLADIAGLGLTIQITELDVTDENTPADEAARDRLVADAYRRFLDAALDERAVKLVVTWGLSDRYSWIVRHQTNPAKWRRDGLSSRPLPFAADLAPKPAFDAIASTLRAAPQRAPG
jgi:endo-1,4-beta-xylanase